MIAQIVVFFCAKLMRKERKILRFVPQKLRKSFANGNPNSRTEWKNVKLNYLVFDKKKVKAPAI